MNKEEKLLSVLKEVYHEEIYTHIGNGEQPAAYNRREQFAPGWPGIEARWTSSAKDGVGTSLNIKSKVWFTMSHGIINETYYPQVDNACTRDMGFVVTDGKDFFSEEKRHTKHKISFLAEGVPAYHVTNNCINGNYTIEKEIIADPSRDSILQKVRFINHKPSMSELNLYCLLTPHIGNYGSGNTGWYGEYKGMPMLFAERNGYALALACSIPWKNRSAGFVGYSDGWQDLIRHKRMTWEFQRAENGNIALIGEIDLLNVQDNEFTIALGFGRNAFEAGQRVRASIFEGFDLAKQKYIQEWEAWQSGLLSLKKSRNTSHKNIYRISTSVLRIHESKRHPGGLIASLSIPWGFSKGDDDIGGYHLVWPRDMVQSAGGLLAANGHDDVRRALNYLMVTQEADGHWAQNMWLDGAPFWNGIQMDQTALPILLVGLAAREGALNNANLHHLWPTVKKAAVFILSNGPITPQDRWEENFGYSPYTIAVEIAALLISADIADLNDSPKEASYFREIADAWNDDIEEWTYVTNTNLAKKVGVEGYYVRIAPGYINSNNPDDYITIINQPDGKNLALVNEVVSPDALSLVRYGLRDAQDPRIKNTIKVIDALLKVETPSGPGWYRYNGDGYGEHADGTPYDGYGVGRLWPLLTGERGHYEIALGRFDEARKMLKAMEAFSNEGGMISEQVWDTEHIHDKELFKGKNTGAAMPLAWSHAEYIKLCRSLKRKKIFDMPTQTYQRYVKDNIKSPIAIWNFNNRRTHIAMGKNLRIETMAPAFVRYTFDAWKTIHDQNTKDTGMGIHFVDLPCNKLYTGRQIVFTFHWREVDRWEKMNFIVEIK